MHEEPIVASEKARALYEHCNFVRSCDNRDTGRRRWLLQPVLVEVTESSLRDKEIRRFRIGPGPLFEKKFEMVLLFAGATGNGKSTLINSLINYLYEVQYDDDIRFELPQRAVLAGSAESVTKEVLIYELYDTRLEQVLTLVDTPGFADTDGPSRDRMTIERITEFLKYEQEHGSSRLDALLFVINATDSRYGVQTIYEYDQVCSLFTVNMRKNIIPIFTKYDGADITALNVLRSARIQVETYFALNNAGFFLESEKNPWGQNAKFEESCHIFDALFDHLSQISHQNLGELVKKLTTQQELERDTKMLFKRINYELEKYSALLNQVQKLKVTEQEVLRKQEFRMAFPNGQLQRIRHDHPTGQNNSLICKHCEQTCHLNCRHLAWKRLCPKISLLTNKCKQCGCLVNVHDNVPYHFVETALMEEIKFEASPREDMIKKALREIYKQLRQSESQRNELMKDIVKKQKMIEQLQLYRSIYNTSSEFIEDLIEQAQKAKRSGYQKDIKELRRHQNILGLIRQITEQEMTDPVQHFRDDLTDAAKYLIKQMPEIADWIKDKLEQHPQLGNGNGVVQRVEQVNRQHHPTLRPPPIQQPNHHYHNPNGNGRTVPSAQRLPVPRRVSDSSNSGTIDSGIELSNGQRSPVPIRHPPVVPTKSVYLRPKNPPSRNPRPCPSSTASTVFETVSSRPPSFRPNPSHPAPRPPPIENMPSRAPINRGANAPSVRDQALMWEQRGMLVVPPYPGKP